MADDDTAAQVPEYPPFNFPTVFADGVLSAVWGGEFIKFYLGRNDPDFRAASKVRQQTPFVLVAMPLSGFLQATTFFDSILERMIEDGTVTQEQIAVQRAKQKDKKNEDKD
jgi:hypothetical protein